MDSRWLASLLNWMVFTVTIENLQSKIFSDPESLEMHGSAFPRSALKKKEHALFSMHYWIVACELDETL